MILILFIVVCILVALFFRVARKLMIVIISLILLLLLLPVFFVSLRFNWISGGEHLPSSSDSKEEAIKRGVYVCDIQLPHTPYQINDTLTIEMKGGWIEKSWRGGYWYWTTLPGNGFTICINAPEGSVEKKMVIRNNKSNSAGYEQLGFYDGQFGGRLEKLPESDTVRYNVLKEDNLDFSKENIIGELVLILKKN